ncbi:hypothetical protein Tco_1015141 [Tanacetum coccineum]|uniref:Uncharacterized protein n=1 Tax=Tanacetum coccineum TaxID=301880 RepID=A0ABQ5FK48_9ASTR
MPLSFWIRIPNGDGTTWPSNFKLPQGDLKLLYLHEKLGDPGADFFDFLCEFGEFDISLFVQAVSGSRYAHKSLRLYRECDSIFYHFWSPPSFTPLVKEDEMILEDEYEGFKNDESLNMDLNDDFNDDEGDVIYLESLLEVFK